MENSLFLAKIIGPYCIIIALGILLNREFYQNVMRDFMRSAALVYIGGILSLIIGFLIVLTHNLWVRDLPVIITIIGWGAIVKGVWLIVFPNNLTKFTEAYLKNAGLLTAHMILIIVLGVALINYGYGGIFVCPLR